MTDVIGRYTTYSKILCLGLIGGWGRVRRRCFVEAAIRFKQLSLESYRGSSICCSFFSTDYDLVETGTTDSLNTTRKTTTTLTTTAVTTAAATTAATTLTSNPAYEQILQ